MTVSWLVRSGDLELSCLAGAGAGARSILYKLRRLGSTVPPLLLTAAEFHDLMYAGRHARRPESSVTLLRGESAPW